MMQPTKGFFKTSDDWRLHRYLSDIALNLAAALDVPMADELRAALIEIEKLTGRAIQTLGEQK